MKQPIYRKLSKAFYIFMIVALGLGFGLNPVAATNVDAKTEVQAADVQTIGDVRSLADKTVASIEGVVTADSNAFSIGSQYSTYIQDATGGINVFAFRKGSFPTVRKGDRIKVTGELTTYRGLKEIVPTSVEVIGTNEALPEPKQITLQDLQTEQTAEQYEGQLVQVTGYIRQIPESPAGGGYNVSLVDEEFNGTTLRVLEKALDIKQIEEGKWYNITAVVGQYDSYQLLPTELADFELATEQPELPSPKGTYTSVVGSVTDGDTIVLKDPVLGATRVRLVNIDTAETYPARTKDRSRSEISRNQKELGDAATEYMQQLISVGDKVSLKVGDEATDAYGRLLAEIIREDGLNLNLEMVEKGHAVTYFIAPIDAEAYPIYQNAVRAAKDAGLGIWNPSNPLLELPFEFRVNDDAKQFNKPVGNSDTMNYVAPNDWKTVPVDKRIFFWNDAEAIAAGFTLGNGGAIDPDPEIPEPEQPVDPEEPETPVNPNPEQPEEPGDGENPGNDNGNKEEVTLVPTNQYGQAKVDTAELEALNEGTILTIDITDNKQRTLVLTRQQVNLLKDKSVTLIVKYGDQEKTYDMQDVRSSTLRVNFYGQGNQSNNNQSNQNYGNNNQNNNKNQNQYNKNQNNDNYKKQDQYNNNQKRQAS